MKLIVTTAAIGLVAGLAYAMVSLIRQPAVALDYRAQTARCEALGVPQSNCDIWR